MVQVTHWVPQVLGLRKGEMSLWPTGGPLRLIEGLCEAWIPEADRRSTDSQNSTVTMASLPQLMPQYMPRVWNKTRMPSLATSIFTVLEVLQKLSS